MKHYILLVLLTLTSTIAWGDKEDANDCARLHVQIGNLRQGTCQLITHKVVHGNLLSSPPATLPSGFSAAFDIKQSFYGPDILLEYSCNGEQILIASQQNYCFMKAGHLNATVISATTHIQASYTKEEGSYFWSKPGLINWVIS